MDVQGITPVLPVPDMVEAVRAWSELLGTPPTFVDGDRFAQFDVAGKRIALAGTDRLSDLAGLMVKVLDISTARTAAEAAGLRVGEIEDGPHELRCHAEAPGGWPLMLYASKL